MMNLYVSLDEARAELHKRWQDKKLKHQIEAELGHNFWPHFKNKPRSLLIRFVLSPENKFKFFIKCAHYVNAAPLVFEFSGDAFIAVNDDKRGLGRCCVYSGQNAATKKIVDLIDFPSNEKRKIKDVTMKNGELLLDFHHSILEFLKYQVDMHDMTTWFSGLGKPIDFYYPYLLHFVAHGVLFEVFFQEKREREILFTKNIVLPTMKKIEQKYGLKPLIVRLYPENPTALEDFYWWSYPPDVNNYIIEYASKHNFRFRELPHLKKQETSPPASSIHEIPLILEHGEAHEEKKLTFA